jgi:hypothetical protein
MSRHINKATKIASLDDHIVEHYLNLPRGMRIRKFGVQQLFRQTTSTDVISNKAKRAMKKLEQLGCRCNKVDMVKGAYEQALVQAYTAFQSDDRFTISSASQYKSCSGLVELGVFAISAIPQGPIENLSGVRVPLAVKERRLFNQSQHNFSNGISQRTGRLYIIVGPTRFLNSDCSSNAELVPSGSSGVCIKAKRLINPGEEITFDYGEEYFGGTCQCKTCEKGRRKEAGDNSESKSRSLRSDTRTIWPQT